VTTTKAAILDHAAAPWRAGPKSAGVRKIGSVASGGIYEPGAQETIL
jgi:hypothetical protein